VVEMEKHTHLGVTVVPHHPIPCTFPGVLVVVNKHFPREVIEIGCHGRGSVRLTIVIVG